MEDQDCRSPTGIDAEGCPPNRSSLSALPMDCVWEIGLYAAVSYRTIGALLQTSRSLYEACNEEFLWREVARCHLEPTLFEVMDADHARRLAVGRAQAAAWFAAQKRLGAIDGDALFIIGNGGWTDMSYLVPGYFKEAVRSFALRSVSLALQKFLSAAMAASTSQVLAQIKCNEADLRSYFSRVRDIAFPMHCIGQQGACVLATSLELCANPSQLTTIDLTRQLIRDQGAEALLTALIASRHTLRSLEKLILAENKLTDAAAAAIGRFLEHATSRCGGLRVLDLRDNPSLSEEVLVCASMGLQRSLSGGTVDVGGGDWFSSRLGDEEYLDSIRTVRLHTLVFNHTAVGEQKGLDGKRKKGHSAAGATALKTLLQCMALLLASARRIAGAGTATVRTSSVLHQQYVLSVCDCRFDPAIVATAVKEVLQAYDAHATMDGSGPTTCSTAIAAPSAPAQSTNRFVLQLDHPVPLEEMWLRAHHAQSENVATHITDGRTASVETLPRLRLLLLGRSLTWGVSCPLGESPVSKEDKGQCCVM